MSPKASSIFSKLITGQFFLYSSFCIIPHSLPDLYCYLCIFFSFPLKFRFKALLNTSLPLAMKSALSLASLSCWNLSIYSQALCSVCVFLHIRVHSLQLTDEKSTCHSVHYLELRSHQWHFSGVFWLVTSFTPQQLAEGWERSVGLIGVNKLFITLLKKNHGSLPYTGLRIVRVTLLRGRPAPSLVCSGLPLPTRLQNTLLLLFLQKDEI